MELYNRDILSVFFDRTFERYINNKMFYRNYCFPEEDVFDYVSCLVDTSLITFIQYIREKLSVSFLEFNDIVQFSSLQDATKNITTVLNSKGDEGYTFVDLGRLLLNDGKERNDAAYRKYGENHTKTAQEFGLTQVLYSKTYLTCIGRILNLMPDNDQLKLLRRTILRNKYIKLMIKLSKSETLSLDSQMGLLSESTKVRRLSNVRKIWQFIVAESEEVAYLLSKVSV